MNLGCMPLQLLLIGRARSLSYCILFIFSVGGSVAEFREIGQLQIGVNSKLLAIHV